MKLVYDKEADAAYIYLEDTIKKGEIKETVPLNHNIVLDLNKDKKLISIEILSASKLIPNKLVKEAIAV